MSLKTGTIYGNPISSSVHQIGFFGEDSELTYQGYRTFRDVCIPVQMSSTFDGAEIMNRSLPLFNLGASREVGEVSFGKSGLKRLAGGTNENVWKFDL